MPLFARLSSAVVDLTEVENVPSAEMTVPSASGVNSQASAASEAQDNTNSHSLWNGIAGRAWYEEAIRVRNNNNLYKVPWTHQNWKEVAERLRQRGFDRHWKQVRSQYTNMKSKWNDRRYLLDQSGFGIDEEGKISVESSVWNRFVAVSTA